MILVGTYRHQLDEKSRVRIPAKFKEKLGDTPFITKGTNGCLFVYSAEEAEKTFFKKFENNDFMDESESRVIRMLTSNAMWAEEDKQGRILLDSELINHAGIKKNIVTIGVYNRVEIWSEENWEKYKNENGNFDESLKNFSKSKE